MNALYAKLDQQEAEIKALKVENIKLKAINGELVAVLKLSRITFKLYEGADYVSYTGTELSKQIDTVIAHAEEK
jgi:hypothetical protein